MECLQSRASQSGDPQGSLERLLMMVDKDKINGVNAMHVVYNTLTYIGVILLFALSPTYPGFIVKRWLTFYSYI